MQGHNTGVRIVKQEVVYRDDAAAPVRLTATVFDGCVMLYASNRQAGSERFGDAFVVAQPSRLADEPLPHVASVLGDDAQLSALATRLALRFKQPVWLHADVDVGLEGAELWRFVEASLFKMLKSELRSS